MTGIVKIISFTWDVFYLHHQIPVIIWFIFSFLILSFTFPSLECIIPWVNSLSLSVRSLSLCVQVLYFDLEIPVIILFIFSFLKETKTVQSFFSFLISNRLNLILFSLFSFILAWTFISLQIKEFRIIGLSINNSVYSSVFFWITGLHFFHLLLGLLLLSLWFWSSSFSFKDLSLEMHADFLKYFWPC